MKDNRITNDTVKDIEEQGGKIRVTGYILVYTS